MLFFIMKNVLYACKANKILHFLKLVDPYIFSPGSVSGYTEEDVGKPARGEIMPTYLNSFTNRVGILSFCQLKNSCQPAKRLVSK